MSKRCENKWYPIYPNRVTTSNVDYVCLSVYKKLLTNQFSLTEVVMGFFLPEIRVFKFCSPNIENKTIQFFFFSLYSQHIFWVGFSTWKAGFRVYLLNLEIVSLTFSGVFILSLSRLIFRKTGSKKWFGNNIILFFELLNYLCHENNYHCCSFCSPKLEF